MSESTDEEHIYHPGMTDAFGAKVVEVVIARSGMECWVNLNGKCVFRSRSPRRLSVEIDGVHTFIFDAVTSTTSEGL